MAFTNLAVFGGSFFTPIVVGKITHTIKWWWTFNLVAIFCAACLPAIVLLCPETAYRRDDTLNLDISAADESAAIRLGGLPAPKRTSSSNDEGLPGAPASATPVSDDDATICPGPEKVSYIKSLALFNGRKSDENFFKLVLRPFPLFLQPAFLWASVTQGTLIGWTVFIGVIMAEFFLGYPLWWDEVKTGYAYTGAFVGAIFGFIIAGLLADWSAKKLTRMNNGIYEPEFRLVLIIPQLIFGVMGLYGFGITIDGMMKEKFHWVVPLVFFGFEVCGMVIGAVASSLYIVDAYRDLSIEGFTCLLIFKNFFSYGLTYKAYDWLVANGTKARPVFNALGSVQLVICLLAIPMCKLVVAILCFSLFFCFCVSLLALFVAYANPNYRRVWQTQPELLLPPRHSQAVPAEMILFILYFNRRDQNALINQVFFNHFTAQLWTHTISWHAFFWIFVELKTPHKDLV